MKTTTVSVYAAFFFILVLSVSCHRDSEAPDAASRGLKCAWNLFRIQLCIY